MTMNADCQPATECVYQIPEAQQVELLKSQFNELYHVLVDYKYVPQAQYKKMGSLERYFSGIPVINFNAVVGWLQDPAEYDTRIQQELSFFGDMPFFWYVDEDASPQFKKSLEKHGFVDAGIFRGVMGPLDKPIESAPLPEGCVLEKVQDEKSMDEFSDLVCEVFEMRGPGKKAYRDLLWDLREKEGQEWTHWIARKDGRVVSAVSTMLQDGVVSFWNGASDSSLRKQGLSTALRKRALQEAVAHGAKFGSSYLMSEGLAFGICSKLGYQTKWRFHAFLSPSK